MRCRNERSNNFNVRSSDITLCLGVERMSSNQLDRVIETALSFEGTTETPINNVIFNFDYYGHRVNGTAYPWCVTYLWDVFRLADASDLFYGGGKCAGATTLYNYYKKQGQTVKPEDARRGDIIFFKWDKNSDYYQHVGLATSNPYTHYTTFIDTIEGNTSPSDNSNGGQVMQRSRKLSYVAGVARPNYKGDEIMTYEQFKIYMQMYIAEREDAAISSNAETEQNFLEAIERGVIKGNGKGNYMPKAFVTRETLINILARCGLIN